MTRDVRTPNLKRQGATLVEVLVAIFVMAIGLLALLVMFPLGALRMGQAIQDDRTAHTAQNAKAVPSLFNVPQDVWAAGFGGTADAYRSPDKNFNFPAP